MPLMPSIATRFKAVNLALLLALSGLGLPAQAALFGDDEARRAILDLRQRLEQSQSINKALIDQNNQIHNQSTLQLRGALLDLQGQIDKLRAELAQSLGAQERLARELSEVQLRQKDALNTVEDRLRRFEPVKAAVDGIEFLVDPAEKAEFDKAMLFVRQADFGAAQVALSAFAGRYGASPYLPSALFWLGNAQYANKAYKESLAQFQRMLALAPNHLRAPEAMLAIANVQSELKDLKAAKKSLEDLIKAHPSTEAAATARERLTRLK